MTLSGMLATVGLWTLALVAASGVISLLMGQVIRRWPPYESGPYDWQREGD